MAGLGSPAKPIGPAVLAAGGSARFFAPEVSHDSEDGLNVVAEVVGQALGVLARANQAWMQSEDATQRLLHLGGLQNPALETGLHQGKQKDDTTTGHVGRHMPVQAHQTANASLDRLHRRLKQPLLEATLIRRNVDLCVDETSETITSHHGSP